MVNSTLALEGKKPHRFHAKESLKNISLFVITQELFACM